jgi:hypothetical protein
MLFKNAVYDILVLSMFCKCMSLLNETIYLNSKVMRSFGKFRDIVLIVNLSVKVFYLGNFVMLTVTQIMMLTGRMIHE